MAYDTDRNTAMTLEPQSGQDWSSTVRSQNKIHKIHPVFILLFFLLIGFNFRILDAAAEFAALPLRVMKRCKHWRSFKSGKIRKDQGKR